MEPITATYLVELAKQMLFVSSFLGGFSALFLGTLLFVDRSNRLVGWSVAGAAFSSSAFIVAIVALTALVVQLHPDAPAFVRSEGTLRVRMIGLGAFVLGMYALLATIGLSGWLRSRRTGIATTLFAGIAAILSCIMMVDID